MAGTPPPGFRGDTFRDRIRFVFEMAAPPDEDRRLTFHFTEQTTFIGPADGDQIPFDPAVPITRTTKTPLTKPCGVEFVQASDEETAFGVIIPAKIRVTLLDEDYEDVADAAYVVVNGDKYIRHYEPPALGLFDVGIHIMVFVAEQER